MKKEFLHRIDIVGHCVSRILTSPWKAEDDGFGGCSAYVELENRDAFELLCHDTDIVVPIQNVSLGDLDVEVVADAYLTMCFGKKIHEVLNGSCWPSLGLLLEDEIFLYMRDFPNINRSGALLIGPYADKVNEHYSIKDTRPYWSIASYP